MNKLIIIGIGIATAAMLALGCGGTGEDAATAQSPKAQFVEQANGVCTKTRNEIKAKAVAWEKMHGGKPIDLDTAWKQVFLPSLRHEAAALNALAAPKRLKGDMAQMIKSLSSGIGTFAEKGDPSGFEQFQAEARASGLEACTF